MRKNKVSIALAIVCSVLGWIPTYSQAQKNAAPLAVSAQRKYDLAPIRTAESILNTGANYSTSLVSSRWEDYFEFSDKAPSSFSPQEVKPWTESEKRSLGITLRRVLKQAPGLVVHAAAGRKIGLFRASSLKANLRSTGAFEASAVTAPDGIVIGQSHFEEMSLDRQVKGLLHELVHSADATGNIELSKQWVDFANPVISKIREDKNPADRYKRYFRDKWVSFYGTNNLGEALAEYFAVWATGSKNYSASPAFAAFAKQLTSPSEKQLQFSDHFKNGRILSTLGHHKAAIQKFEKCVKLQPLSGKPYVYLAAAYEDLDQFGKAIVNARKAISIFRAAGVPDAEPESAYAYLTLAYSLERLEKNTDAIEVLDRLLTTELTDSDRKVALLNRARCLAHVYRFSDSAADYRAYYKPVKRHGRFADVRADSKSVFAKIDEDIRRYPKNADIYEIRAKYRVFFGDKERDPKVKTELYRLALQDIALAEACPDGDKIYSQIFSAYVYVKLNDIKAARAAYETAAAIDRRNLDVRIFHIKLLQIDGKHVEALRWYDGLVADLRE
jgi:tetratricopeptide (TPR) repeat protein